MENPSDQLEFLLSQFLAGPGQLKQALEGLGEKDLDLALTSDSWSIRKIVHHIADGDDLWKAGIKAALGGAKSFNLKWYWEKPQDEWTVCWNYASRPIEPSLTLFETNRGYMSYLFKNVPGALEKSMPITWLSGEEQKLTVKDIVEMQTQHVAGHIEDIRRIRAAHQR